MDTIHNALMKQDNPKTGGKKEVRKDEETGCDYFNYNANTQCRPEVSPDQSSQWEKVSQDTAIHHTGERSRERNHSTPSTNFEENSFYWRDFHST